MTIQDDGGEEVCTSRSDEGVPPAYVVHTARVLLVAWIAVGAAHTAISLARQGIHPSRPPALGLTADEPVRDVAVLHELLQGRPDDTVLLVLPPSADSSDVAYLRFQLAHLLYPLQVYGARATEAGSPDAEPGAAGRSFDLLVTGPGIMPPVEWKSVDRREPYTVWSRSVP